MMGFYIISDAYKKSWIEYIYGEKGTTTLYQCNHMKKFSLSEKDGCINENDDITDHSEWESFLSKIENAESSKDLEDIFEVDHFLKEMALDYLTGSTDHVNTGHNFYMYKQPNGKWIYLSYDFDLDFGIFFTDLIKTSYTEFFKKDIHLLDILIFKEPKRFEKILSEIVESTMNPSVLYPSIDELKQFIKPYVKIEKTPDATGRLPGRLNKNGINESFSFEQWDAFCEFTSNKFSGAGYIYGLKYWILIKYRLVCKNYGMECDPTYIDENFEYPINENLNFKDNKNSGNGIDVPFPEEEGNTSTEITTVTKTSISTPTVITENPSGKTVKCLAELNGYSCCPDHITEVYDHDEYGDWGYDFYNNIWCGLTPYEEPLSHVDDECWSEPLGYSCCKSCKVYEIDTNGSRGYELNQWCGIPSYFENN